MQRKTYPPEQRAEVVELVRQVGIAEAAKRTGIATGTVASWASRAGVNALERADPTPAAIAAVATVAQRKAKLADDLLDDAQRLRRQLFAPCVERKAMAAGQMRDVQIVEIEHEQPPFADQRQIMVSLAIAVDKIQILTGEATERIETLVGGPRATADHIADELERRRQAKAS